MTVRHRHAFLDFVAILALAAWTEDAGAQVNAFINQLGVIDLRGSGMERPLAQQMGQIPHGPQRSPPRPRRDEVRSRAQHLRRPVGNGDAVVQGGPRP
ncbi:MAG: hypothetical protein EHM50_06805 [Lysobacterales bacterium]|nr:MAG: hypothetical protein EHM50_06805 [Xanthomonadales bacterium]